jgi:hypothetical protein
MPAANRPYSIAAAACSSARKLHSNVRTTWSFPKNLVAPRAESHARVRVCHARR